MSGMKILQSLYPLLRHLSYEHAHKVTLYALAAVGLRKCKKPDFLRLQQRVWGVDFYSPIGLAAGFDKDGVAISGHFHLGFGFVELGTVTPKPQPGNPAPRLFADEKHGALINLMGCPSVGLGVFGARMGSYHLAHEDHWGVVGVNLGINADTTDPVEDCRLGMQHVGALCNYVVLNLSSPNTEGLRALLKPEALRPLLEAVLAEREKIESSLPALVVKISPDIADEDIAPVCKVLIEQEINGVILTNTTTDRPVDLDPEISKEKGGLSGRPLRQKSTKLIEAFYKELDGQMPIIGCGGVDSAGAAYEKIKAGACLVQLYTGLVMKGPQLVHDINSELDKLIQQDGFNSISDAIGSAHQNK